MAHMHLDRVLEVVRTTGCTRLAAYDAANYPIDHVEAATVSDLCDQVEDLVRNTSGTIRLECWAPPPAKLPGTRKADAPKAERFVFHVRGLLGTSTGVRVPGRSEPTRSDDPGAINDHVNAAVNMARTQWEVELLRARVSELTADDDDDDDDDDQDDAPPATASGLFGMTPDQTFQVLGGLKELVAPLFTPLSGRTVTGQPAAPQLTPQEQQLVQAFKRFSADQPDTAKAIINDLLTNYGPGAKPPEPEKPAPNENG